MDFFLNSGANFNNKSVLKNMIKLSNNQSEIIFGHCIIKNKFISYKYFEIILDKTILACHFIISLLREKIID